MSGREFLYHLSRVPFRIRCGLYWLSRRPAWLRDMAQNLYWKIVFRFFLPTVLVQPNMRAGLIQFIEVLRKAQFSKKEARQRIAAEMGVSGHLTDTEAGLLLDYILRGHLPYPTVEEAILALPRGGTILCAPGAQYLTKPIVFPSKSIRLIGGQFYIMGEAAMEMSSSGRISIIGCMFMGYPPSPRDWSPRGEIIERDGPPDAIRVHVEP